MWWILAGALAAVELQSGTFYLLMLAVGAVAGALAAHFGLGPTTQIGVAAGMGVLSVGALWWRRHSRPDALPTEHNPQALLDIGQTVQVLAWTPEGTARVSYRGADWTARLSVHPGEPLPHPLPPPGAYRITGIHGSQLIVETL